MEEAFLLLLLKRKKQKSGMLLLIEKFSLSDRPRTLNGRETTHHGIFIFMPKTSLEEDVNGYNILDPW